jgi:hypothetical protein
MEWTWGVGVGYLIFEQQRLIGIEWRFPRCKEWWEKKAFRRLATFDFLDGDM